MKRDGKAKGAGTNYDYETWAGMKSDGKAKGAGPGQTMKNWPNYEKFWSQNQ